MVAPSQEQEPKIAQKPEKIKSGEFSEVKEKLPGRSLETAFAGGERIIDEPTAKQIKLDDLIDYYLAPTFDGDYYEYLRKNGQENAGKTAGRLGRLLEEKTPLDGVALKLRQDFLKDLVGPEVGGEKSNIEQRVKIQELRGLADSLRTDLDKELLKINNSDSLREAIDDLKFNLFYLDFYKKSGFDRQLNGIKENLAGGGVESAFMRELQVDLDQMSDELKRHSEQLEQSGIRDKFSNFIKVLEGRLAKGIYDAKGLNFSKTIGFNSVEEFDRACSDIADKGKLVEGFSRKLYAFSDLLIFAAMILEKKLKPMEITEDNAIEFREMRNPHLCRHSGYNNKNKVVGADLVLTPDQPNVILTGKNAAGKSKCAEAAILNALLAQNTGFGFVSGGRYSMRRQLTFLRSIPEEAGEAQFSRGQKEMRAVAAEVEQSKDKNLLVMDEILTSTDSLGAISLVLAMLEHNAEKGGMGILTIHSRDLEVVRANNLAPSVSFLKAKEGKGGKMTYQWEEGVGRADPIALAKEAGLSAEVIKLAQKIKNGIEKAEAASK